MMYARFGQTFQLWAYEFLLLRDLCISRELDNFQGSFQFLSFVVSSKKRSLCLEKQGRIQGWKEGCEGKTTEWL